jgi:PIN domain nuclease of toxin-antitoxin system
LPVFAYEERRTAIADHEYVIGEASFDAAVVEAMQRDPRSEVPDTPDRIVAATPFHCGVPVISRDGKIRAYSVRTIG